MIRNLISPEDINAFEKSEDAIMAVKIMCLIPSQKVFINRPEFTIVRKFILTETALLNASCSGVLANMTVNELKAARVLDG